MNEITYQAPSHDHNHPVTRTGWPTNTPGLLISRDDPTHDYADNCKPGICWRVVHHSGLRIAHCLTHEAAGWVADTLGSLADWTQHPAELAVVPLLPARVRDTVHAAGGRFDQARPATHRAAS